jgi:hypothetical protein
MGKFNPHKKQFGRPPKPDDEAEADDKQDNGEGLPTPFQTKQLARRLEGIKEAKRILDFLPQPGESLHCVCTARMDLSDVINAILSKCGTCERMVIATLGYNERNLASLFNLLDNNYCKSITLLCSLFFRAHKRGLWENTLKGFRERGQRAAACHSHAKVVTMKMSDGASYTIEGSSNLCGNGSGREQFAMFNDPKLMDWHTAWIVELVGRHEQTVSNEQETTKAGQANGEPEAAKNGNR